jgi:O-antigen/teichoic acid export membrane protein
MVVSPGPVLGLLFGEQYAGLGSVARILALGYWVVLVTGLNGVTLSAIGAIKDMAVASGVGLGLTLGIGLVLVRLFGPVGAATTNTIAYIFANVAFSVLLFRRTRVTPFRSDSSRLFVYSGAVLLVSIALVELVLPDTAAWSLAVSFAAAACWLVGGVFGKPFAMGWSEMRRVVSRTKAGADDETQDPVDPLAPTGVDVP